MTYSDQYLRELIDNDNPIHGTLVDVCRELLAARQTIHDMQLSGAETATLAELTMAQAERDAYRAQIPQWIPCSERMPEDDVPVFIWSHTEARNIGYYNAYYKEWRDGDSRWSPPPTHWQPLPSPPVPATESNHE